MFKKTAQLARDGFPYGDHQDGDDDHHQDDGGERSL